MHPCTTDNAPLHDGQCTPVWLAMRPRWVVGLPTVGQASARTEHDTCRHGTRYLPARNTIPAGMGHDTCRHGTRYLPAWDTIPAGMGHDTCRHGTRYLPARNGVVEGGQMAHGVMCPACAIRPFNVSGLPLLRLNPCEQAFQIVQAAQHHPAGTHSGHDVRRAGTRGGRLDRLLGLERSREPHVHVRWDGKNTQAGRQDRPFESYLDWLQLFVRW
jgi:hypothetical protein